MGSLNGTVGETECVRIERIGRLGLNTTDDQVMLVSDESSRLHEYLSGLAQDAWSRPSACGAWEVRDVVAHLAAGSQFYADTISRGSVGDHSAPEGRPTAGSVDYTGPYSKVVAQRGIDVRESLSGHVLDEYETSNEALNLLFGSLGPAEWERQCYHPSCLHPARRFVAFRMLELALHGWDVRSKLDPPAGLSADSVQMLVELMPTVLRWFFGPPVGPTENRRYRFELSDPGMSSMDLTVVTQQTSLGPAASPSPDLTFRCDAETFVLAMSGRVKIAEAVRDGRMSTEGNERLVAQLELGFAGV